MKTLILGEMIFVDSTDDFHDPSMGEVYTIIEDIESITKVEDDFDFDSLVFKYDAYIILEDYVGQIYFQKELDKNK
jgi:hypothetical protein